VLKFLALLLLVPLSALADTNASALIAYGMPGVEAEYLGNAIGDGSTKIYGVPWYIKSQASGAVAAFQCNSTDSIVAQFGRTSSGAFQSLVEPRANQTSVSGQQLGRGAIRFIDNVDTRTMEMGFYSFGGGIFTDNIFEFFTRGVSVRNFSGSTPSFVDLRDQNDVNSMRFKHDGSTGHITTYGAGDIMVEPVATPTWDFGTTGDLTQQASGGSVVLSAASTAVRQPASNSISAAGSARTDCTALTKVFNNVTTVAAGQGVCLWGGTAGLHVRVRNGGANALKVYPNSGTATINGGAGGAGVTLSNTGAHVGDCDVVATDTWVCTDSASAS
jgi:hypothetical protein